MDKMTILFGCLFLCVLLAPPRATAQSSTYFSANPDTEFCISVIFGEHGRGEYTMTIDDPGYPGAGWVDIHRTSFVSGPHNPVINPVCFNTIGRKVGDYATVKFRIETPQGDINYDYGICVSRHEDVDFVGPSANPCDAANAHTDLFSADLLQSEVHALPGERVKFTLLVSSNFDMLIRLDKESGPQMQITRTQVTTPGEQSVDIYIDSPQRTGDYVFTITAKVDGCPQESCAKRVTGVLHVSEAGQQGFRVELSPKNKDVFGTGSSTFYVTVQNFEPAQSFDLDVETVPQLITDFSAQQFTLAQGRSRLFQFSVRPESASPLRYTIRAKAKGEVGGEKTVESFLTVQEPVSDFNRIAENNSQFRDDADDYADRYGDGASLDDWQRVRDAADDLGDNGHVNGEPQPVNWVLIAGVIVAVALIAFYVYRHTTVVQDSGGSFPGI